MADAPDDVDVADLLQIHGTATAHVRNTANQLNAELEQLRGEATVGELQDLRRTVETYRQIGIPTPFPDQIMAARMDPVTRARDIGNDAFQTLQNAAREHVQQTYGIKNPSEDVLPTRMISIHGSDVFNRAQGVQNELMRKMRHPNYRRHVPRDYDMLPPGPPPAPPPPPPPPAPTATFASAYSRKKRRIW